MNWIISHQSALEFLRKNTADKILTLPTANSSQLPLVLPDTELLHLITRWGMLIPLHVLFGGEEARKESKRLHFHVYSDQLPRESFMQAEPGLLISVPELLFAQMARELTLYELIMFGYELCGSYRIWKDDLTGQGFRNDLPLTTVAKLSRYLSSMNEFYGRKSAFKALPHILEGSASPMESIMAMMLTLPYRLGGFGFPRPLLNSPVDVLLKSGGTARVKHYICDLLWLEHLLSVEYDSDSHHIKTEQIAKDAEKRNALNSMGIRVITITRQQLMDVDLFHDAAVEISELLGKRLRYDMREFNKHHAELRKQILPGYAREVW